MVVLLLLWCCFAIVLLSIITLLVVLATQVSILFSCLNSFEVCLSEVTDVSIS